MLVQAAGYRVWATRPAGLAGAGVGDRVRFLAEVGAPRTMRPSPSPSAPVAPRCWLEPCPAGGLGARAGGFGVARRRRACMMFICR